MRAGRREDRRALGRDPAAEAEAGHAGRAGPFGDALGRLAEPRLGIDPALAGQDQVAVVEGRLEARPGP